MLFFWRFGLSIKVYCIPSDTWMFILIILKKYFVSIRNIYCGQFWWEDDLRTTHRKMVAVNNYVHEFACKTISVLEISFSSIITRRKNPKISPLFNLFQMFSLCIYGIWLENCKVCRECNKLYKQQLVVIAPWTRWTKLNIQLKKKIENHFFVRFILPK